MEIRDGLLDGFGPKFRDRDQLERCGTPSGARLDTPPRTRQGPKIGEKDFPTALPRAARAIGWDA